MKSSITKIIAHRGFSSQFPENTLIAFQKAIDIGVDFIELDVHKTKDNVIAVIHDDSIDRTNSNGKIGKISDFTFNDLQELSFGFAGKFGSRFIKEKISTLDEVLHLAKNRIKVCIEIKVEECERKILEIISTNKMEKRVIIFSFSKTVLRNIRKLNAAIPMLFLCEEYSEDHLCTALDTGCFAIGIGNKTIVEIELIKNCHSKNIEIWQWTVDDVSKMQMLINFGADGLITNRPDKALQLIQFLK